MRIVAIFYDILTIVIMEQTMEMDEDFWSRYLAHNQATREFKMKPLLHYLELAELFAGSTAAGKYAPLLYLGRRS